MSEILQEYVDSASQRLRADRQNGVIRGVKLLGLKSRNGRRYRENALAEAVALYEGSKVNVNHPKGHPLSPRDYQDRLGVIRGVEFRQADGLFGDLHFNPKHGLSEQLVWDAEHAPQNVGLSHNVLARTTRDGDDTVVEAITKVQSIDLVADPATTVGLFEQAASRDTHESDDSEESIAWENVSVDGLRRHRPDVLELIEHAYEAKIEALRHQLDEVAVREATVERRQRIAELLLEYELPLPQSEDGSARQIVSNGFLQSLMNAVSDDALRQLIEERAALVRSATLWNGSEGQSSRGPRSRCQSTFTHDRDVANAQEFVAAIRGG